MPFHLARARALVFEVPRTAKLAYCLMRDPRVPVAHKVAVGVTVGLIVGPLDVPAWIPVIGDLDMLALGILAVKVFVDACPDDVVEEHRASMQRGESVFDRDLRVALALAQQGIHRLSTRRQAWLAGSASRQSEDEPT
jgi:uncharacterized membrane protein YkvA (DUF1232 family)